ncbi:hypothetical protein JRQ81_002600 [Phrynocephalus forsythii]|uniref:Uncharacterized protein n=1 Tax=Phrynocephalus forsythii TaxID=171643 RepID=A0A9Q1AWT2_9SAUR|nr:hypothetical protein JRQ81_002600 [Phrynocephalus forsythii]
MDRMDKVLKKHNLQTVFRHTTKIQQMLWSAKDKMNPFATAGVYQIPCSCGQVDIGTTKCKIQTRIREHERHCRLKPPEKSAVAEHTLKQMGHEILFQDTEVLVNTTNHYVRLHREANEINKHKQSFNKKEESLKINKAWLPVLKTAESKKVNAQRFPSSHKQRWSVHTTEQLTPINFILGFLLPLITLKFLNPSITIQ